MSTATQISPPLPPTIPTGWMQVAATSEGLFPFGRACSWYAILNRTAAAAESSAQVCAGRPSRTMLRSGDSAKGLEGLPCAVSSRHDRKLRQRKARERDVLWSGSGGETLEPQATAMATSLKALQFDYGQLPMHYEIQHVTLREGEDAEPEMVAHSPPQCRRR
jgi:hypothetical protein